MTHWMYWHATDLEILKWRLKELIENKVNDKHLKEELLRDSGNLCEKNHAETRK